MRAACWMCTEEEISLGRHLTTLTPYNSWRIVATTLILVAFVFIHLVGQYVLPGGTHSANRGVG